MPELLKNIFFQKPFVAKLGKEISGIEPNFPLAGFTDLVFDQDWKDKELKERMAHISHSINSALSMSYPEALEILTQISPKFNGFDAMVFPDYVEKFGLEHPNISLKALKIFTSFGSSEFAIRPFIVRHESVTMKALLTWSKDVDPHVRRLASEGCRPRLPWAMALPKFKRDPSPVLPILENLRADPSEYVRKSVSNNLNDISKDNPEIALAIAREWNQVENSFTRWIVKQGLRSLIKLGDPEALSILGYASPKVGIKNLTLKPNPIPLGQTLVFGFNLINQLPYHQPLLIDYIVHLVRSKRKTIPKVFKLRQIELGPKETVKVKKSLPIKETSTRKYYPGVHKLEIQINGKVVGQAHFELTGKD